MKKILALTTAIIMLTMTQTLYADDSGCGFNGINYTQATTFVSTLQDALKTDNKVKVADLVSYPLRVNSTTKTGKVSTHYIKTKQAFLKQYPTLFDENAKKALLGNKEIFCNYQGAMLGNGLIWFQTGTNGAKIFSMNK